MSSWLGTIGKVAGNIGGSFIGDPGLGNQIGAAFGGSGNQGGSNTNQTTTSNGNQTTSSNQSMTPNEPGYAQQFRQGQMGQLAGAEAKAQQPLYGQAQVAGYMNNLNDLANSSMSSLKQNLARSGALNSGRLSQGISDITMGKAGAAANYQAQLPMLNQQAEMAALNPLLATGAGLAGHAPVGYTSAGTGNVNTSGTSNTTGNTNLVGAPWYKNLAGMPGPYQAMTGLLGGMGGNGGGRDATVLDYANNNGQNAPSPGYYDYQNMFGTP